MNATPANETTPDSVMDPPTTEEMSTINANCENRNSHGEENEANVQVSSSTTAVEVESTIPESKNTNCSLDDNLSADEFVSTPESKVQNIDKQSNNQVPGLHGDVQDTISESTCEGNSQGNTLCTEQPLSDHDKATDLGVGDTMDTTECTNASEVPNNENGASKKVRMFELENIGPEASGTKKCLLNEVGSKILSECTAVNDTQSDQSSDKNASDENIPGFADGDAKKCNSSVDGRVEMKNKNNEMGTETMVSNNKDQAKRGIVTESTSQDSVMSNIDKNELKVTGAKESIMITDVVIEVKNSSQALNSLSAYRNSVPGNNSDSDVNSATSDSSCDSSSGTDSGEESDDDSDGSLPDNATVSGNESSGSQKKDLSTEKRDVTGEIPPKPSTKGEFTLDDLPALEDLQITLPEDVVMEEVGTVFRIIDVLVVVQGRRGLPALDADTLMFLEGQQLIGQIFETFGPVPAPFYSIRFNKAEDIKAAGIDVGKPVFYVPLSDQFTRYVFVEQLRRLKGSDASWEHNNEPPAKFLEYSDDEDERRAKARLRGRDVGGDEEQTEDGNNDPGKRKKRKKKFEGGGWRGGRGGGQFRPSRPPIPVGTGGINNQASPTNGYNTRPQIPQWPPAQKFHRPQRFQGHRGQNPLGSGAWNQSGTVHHPTHHPRLPWWGRPPPPANSHPHPIPGHPPPPTGYHQLHPHSVRGPALRPPGIPPPPPQTMGGSPWATGPPVPFLQQPVPAWAVPAPPGGWKTEPGSSSAPIPMDTRFIQNSTVHAPDPAPPGVLPGPKLEGAPTVTSGHMFPFGAQNFIGPA